MSQVRSGRSDDAAIRRNPAALRAADALALAATPVFAVMALLTAAQAGGAADLLGSATHHASPLTGMVPMYALMSAFHSAPWLRLISRATMPPN